MKTILLAVAAFGLFSTTTVAASVAGSYGVGLSSETPSADVRAGSPGKGRVFIGGGLRGGK